MKRKLSVSVVMFLLGIFLVSGAAMALDSPYDGWWYRSDQPGSGVSVEIQGNHLFLAMYSYNASGQSMWLTSGGPMSSETSFSGSLISFSGAPPNPTSVVAGTVQLTFTSSTQATISWTVNAEYGSNGSKSLVKFLDDQLGGGADDLRDINGWWWGGDAYNGMGFFLEAQGNALFMAWYKYRSDGSPVWWTAFAAPGAFPSGGKSFGGNWATYQNGQTLGGDWQNPTSSDAGSLSMTLNGYSSITLTTGGTTYSLERFRLGQFYDPPAMVYAGKTNQATITAQNAVALVMGGLNGVSAIGAFADLLSGISLTSLKDPTGKVPLNEKAIQTIHELTAVQQDTINGNCGGSLSYLLNINESTYAISGYLNADSFCNNGANLDGRADLSGSVTQGANSSLSISINLDIQEMSFASSTEDLTIDGVITGSADINSSTISASVNANALTRDNNLSIVYKLEDYVLATNLSSAAISNPTGASAVFTLSGRFYHPAYGWISTESDNIQIAGSGSLAGNIIAYGAGGTKSKVTLLSTETFQVEADTNGDGVYDWNSGVLYVTDFFPLDTGALPDPGTGGGGSGDSAYWAAYTTVCCSTSAYTFQATIDGVSDSKTNASCETEPAAPNYVPVSAGAKTVIVQYTSPGCGSGSGTTSATFEAGKCYVINNYVESGSIYVSIVEDPSCGY